MCVCVCVCVCINPSLSIHPTLLPTWYPHICSLRLCLYFCFINKIVYTNFSRFHIYTLIYIYFSLSDVPLYDGLNSVPFYGLAIIHAIQVPRPLSPFVCRWRLRLLPCPGCCKGFCSEHWGACIFLNYGLL